MEIPTIMKIILHFSNIFTNTGTSVKHRSS